MAARLRSGLDFGSLFGLESSVLVFDSRCISLFLEILALAIFSIAEKKRSCIILENNRTKFPSKISNKF